jgi:hypothetical protein
MTLGFTVKNEAPPSDGPPDNKPRLSFKSPSRLVDCRVDFCQRKMRGDENGEF